MDELEYVDFCETASTLARQLRRDDACDLVVALTHMRMPDDERLAKHVDGVDLVLGGHDHINLQRRVHGRWIVKSGTDFKNFSTISVRVRSGATNGCARGECDDGEEEHEGVGVDKRIFIDAPVCHAVTSDVRPDAFFERFVQEQLAVLGDEYFDYLAYSKTELDGRFVSIRTRETGLGNLVCDASMFLSLSFSIPLSSFVSRSLLFCAES